MKILTISASPYLLTSLGKINSSVINHLKSQDHTVESAVWLHDTSYFLVDESDARYYYENPHKVCRLHSLSNLQEKMINQVYDVIKNFQPDIVLTIGDYKETFFIHAIKQKYAKGFKWVAILTMLPHFITPQIKEELSEIDYAICTNKETALAIEKCNISYLYAHPGIDLNKFTFDGKKDYSKLRIAAALRNNKLSNIGCFLQSLRLLKERNIEFEAILHTNIDDAGEHDIPELIRRFDVENSVVLPSKYSSLIHGVSDDYLRDIYSKSCLYVDTAGQSLVGMAVLEAMSCGCIPMFGMTLASKDILYEISDNLCEISSVPFIGEYGHEYRICSPESIANQVESYLLLSKEKKEEKIKKCLEISQRYSNSVFVINLDSVLREVVDDRKSILSVDVLT